MRMRLLRDWDAICEEGGRKEDTWIGGDGGGGDVVECLIITKPTYFIKRSNRIISIAERNI